MLYRNCRPPGRHPLLTYLFRASAAQQVIRDAQSKTELRRSLFDQMAHFAWKQVAPDAKLCATLRLQGFQLNLTILTIGFYESVRLLWQCK